jgi:hypothetical protein
MTSSEDSKLLSTDAVESPFLLTPAWVILALLLLSLS